MGSTKEEQSRVRSLLLDTVSLLCKNGLTFKKQMKIQGLLGITLDEDDVFIVHINEAVGDAVADAAKRTGERSSSRESASNRTPDKNVARKRGATSSPASRGPPDKRQAGGEVIVIVEDDKRKLDKKPLITNVRGGLPPNHPLTPQKNPAMRNPAMGSPNRMPFVRVVGSPNQRGGMVSPQRSYRGRPSLHAIRCPFCYTSFPNQFAVVQHVQEVHKNMVPPGQQIGQIRPLGPPVPQTGVNAKRVLYPPPPPLVLRKNRHENNSDAPIDIDASPPSVDNQTSGTPIELTPDALPSAEGPDIQSNPAPNDASSETGAQAQTPESTPDVGPEPGQEQQPEPQDTGNVREEKQETGDATAPEKAGSDKSEAGSRPASAVAKASDGSDTEGYSPHAPDKAQNRPSSGRESVASGMSESETTSRSPGEGQTESGSAKSNSDPPEVQPTTEPFDLLKSSTCQTATIKAITIAPEQPVAATAGNQSANILNQLESAFGQTQPCAKPSIDGGSTMQTVTTLGQINITPQAAATPQPSMPMPVSARTMEIKPEGPFGSEIMGAGGQQMFENLNRPVVNNTQPTQPNQFLAGPQVSNTLPVGPPPGMAGPPGNMQMRFISAMGQPGPPPNIENPLFQHQPGFAPPSDPPNNPFGGGNFNGFM